MKYTHKSNLGSPLYSYRKKNFLRSIILLLEAIRLHLDNKEGW